MYPILYWKVAALLSKNYQDVVGFFWDLHQRPKYYLFANQCLLFLAALMSELGRNESLLHFRSCVNDLDLMPTDLDFLGYLIKNRSQF